MTQIITKNYHPPLNHRNSRHKGHGTGVVFHTPVARDSRPGKRRRSIPPAKPGTLRLGHAHLKVRSLDRSVPFYARMLGLHLNERVGRFAFLAAGNEHHSIALEEIGDWAVNPSRRAVGVAHIAFQAPDTATFAAMRKKLLDANLPLISRNNGISWTFRFKDPDGNEIEIYVDRRRSPGGAQLWGGRWHLPPKCDASTN